MYEALSVGKQVTEAVAQTYQKLIDKNPQDWHLLRLYTGNIVPGKLVTPLEHEGRKPAPPPSINSRFLDAQGNRKVTNRENFVGRRRQLQKCLESLNTKTGVLIHGMDGLGKSSIALRLCDRRPNYERIVWEGRVDQQNFVLELSTNKILQNSSKPLLKILNNSQKELKYRLRQVFDELNSEGEKFLFVLDDFEQNLELRDDGDVLKPYAAEVLNAIIWAIEDTYSSHRIIITCRYDFDFNKWNNFYKQPLNAMRGAELEKMCNHLAVFDNKSQKDETWQSKMKKLADGNPGLLVFLNDQLQNSSIDKDDILNRWEAEPKNLQDQVLTNELKEYLVNYPRIREILQRGLIFDLPVPKERLVQICQTIGNKNIEQDINQAKALGLLEVSPDESLRVPRILHLEKLCETHLYKQAATILYPLWGEPKENSKDISEERHLEILRLAQLGNETEITLKMTEILANRWLEQSCFQEAVELCTQTLERLKDIYNDLPTNHVARVKSILASSYIGLEYYEKAKLQYNSVIVSEWLIISTKKPRLLVLSLFLSPQKIWFLRSAPRAALPPAMNGINKSNPLPFCLLPPARTALFLESSALAAFSTRYG